MKKKKPYNYSLPHIKALRKVILLRKMWRPAYFARMSSRDMQRAYNGIGPERWSARFRAFTTFLLSKLEPSALIHDVEWSRREKSFRAFFVSNIRLAVNASREAGLKIGIPAGILCMLFGWSGYRKGGAKK